MDIETKNQINIEKQSLSQRVGAIQQGSQDVNALIGEYIPFIKSCIYKATGKHISKESDEMSIGLLAFNEAIKAYNEDKGSFLAFANWVIKRRIIDYKRTLKKRRNETSFSELPEGQLEKIYSLLPTNEYMVENPLKLEIEALSSQLKVFDIDFDDLVSVSPKAKKTKEACIQAIKYIMDNHQVYLKLKQNHRLPIKKIQENLNIPQKLLDRHRKYIITVVEILSGDYIILKEYVAFIKKGEHT